MAKRYSIPPAKLRFLKDQEFEDEATILLAEYGRERGAVTAPPIPIDEIVEIYLELQLTFDDMQQLFGVDDVHGALWVKTRRVGIDHHLDPTENPSMLGRYRFTLAHEAGHWRLHRHLFQGNANQRSLLPENSDRPEYICRSSDSEPIEYQANRFASCLLMPKEMVKRVWHEWRGNMGPIYLDDLRAQYQSNMSSKHLCRGGSKLGDDAETKILFEQASRPLAEKFEVSTEAMRIRLESLGFLLRKKVGSLFD